MQTHSAARGVLALTLLACLLGGVPASAAPTTPNEPALTQHPGAPYRVFITEVGDAWAKDQPFTGSFRKTITTTDGKDHVIQLTPVVHDGGLMVKVVDTVDGRPVERKGYELMGPNGTERVGNADAGMLLVHLRDVDQPDARWHMVMRSGAKPEFVWADGKAPGDPAATRFEVSIYPHVKRVVFGQAFNDGYTTTVVLADGTRRTLKLTPESVDGHTSMRLDDNGRTTRIPLDRTVVIGNLMVYVADMRRVRTMWRKVCANDPNKGCSG